MGYRKQTTAAEPSAALRRKEGEARGVRQVRSPRMSWAETAMRAAANCRFAPTADDLRAPPSRRGFTLVELLVVIAILGTITVIAVPVVMQAISTSKDAAIKTEIDMLHMGVMNYRNEYGSFPPSRSGITNTTDAAVKHLRRLFVRCPDAIAQLQAVLNGTPITPANALGFWLCGYTGSPEFPLRLPNASRRPLYDFDRSRLDPVTFRYRLTHTGSTPLIYIDSARYLDAGVDGSNIDGQQIFVWRDDPNFSPKTTTPPLLSADPNQAVLHPDSFQIFSAGRDGEFYTDDDVSNMWPGTWGDFKEKMRKGQ